MLRNFLFRKSSLHFMFSKMALPRSIGVIGSGVMGRGIALVSALKLGPKTKTTVIDLNQDSLDSCQQYHQSMLTKRFFDEIWNFREKRVIIKK